MLHVVLVEPEIHWNTGNVGRTCLGADANLHLVRPLGFSLADWQVKRAGLDYWNHVKPEVWSSWSAFEEALPELGQAFFISPDGERSLWDVTYPEKTVLIFGKETAGFSPGIRARYRERLIRIPQNDRQVRSLNQSTCVGIAVYEVVRQRR